LIYQQSEIKVYIDTSASCLSCKQGEEIIQTNTCRTNAEDDRERAAPITTASSTLLMFTYE